MKAQTVQDPTDLMRQLCQAKSLERESGRIRPRVPAYWQARGTIVSLRHRINQLNVRACPTCHGHGTHSIEIAPIVTKCDWCGGTGYDEERERKCWKCNGLRWFWIPNFKAVQCETCHGKRVVTKSNICQN